MTRLDIPTPDGGGQAVHPDVVYIPSRFLGYPYWMACTPYPFGRDREENPIIRVSDDGFHWHPFPGAPDPLVSPPLDPTWHHADTDLVIHDDTLYLFYISTSRDKAETIFYVITTKDGIHWAQPIEVYRDEWGVSPSVTVSANGEWSLWYVWRDALSRSQESRLYRRKAEDPTTWGDPELCLIEIPGHVVWHLDVVAVGKGYEALITAFPIGTDPSRSRLFHVVSSDGLKFILSLEGPILIPSWSGWDNRMIYRSTFVKPSADMYGVWYSAASWGMRCGIGYLEGPLNKLRNVDCRYNNNSLRLQFVGENLAGLLKYAIYRILPTRFYSVLISFRDHLKSIISNQS